MTKKKVEPIETTSTGQSIEAVTENERILPEAGVVVNLDIDWNGNVMRYTMRTFDDDEMLERLVQLAIKLEGSGMKIASMKGKPVKKGEAKPTSKGTPKKAEPEGIIDETVIEVTSIYINSGKKGNYAFVKGTPGFEKDGAICFDDAWQGTGYDLQGQDAGKFYEGADFGFVRAVLRIDGGKARVWKFLTSHEQIAF